MISNLKTERLEIQSLELSDSQSKPLQLELLSVLTPRVLETLPPHWQAVDTMNHVKKWLEARMDEGGCLIVRNRLVQQSKKGELLGMVLLSNPIRLDDVDEVRIGYLLSEASWGKGYGSEVVAGMVEYYSKQSRPRSVKLVGGVDNDNIGSIKVLTNNGFRLNTDESNDRVSFYQRVIK